MGSPTQHPGYCTVEIGLRCRRLRLPLARGGGDALADAGRWAAGLFLANFHFAKTGTRTTSVLNFPSFPAPELLVVSGRRTVLCRISGALRPRPPPSPPAGQSIPSSSGSALKSVVAASFALSVAQTSTQPTTAYFSPFTRAWGAGHRERLWPSPPPGSRYLNAARGPCLVDGLGSLAWRSARWPTGPGPRYPGAFAALPVSGTAAVIAGGLTAPTAGAERLLGLSPFQWLGARSYSLYLWHWPSAGHRRRAGRKDITRAGIFWFAPGSSGRRAIHGELSVRR